VGRSWSTCTPILSAPATRVNARRQGRRRIRRLSLLRIQTGVPVATITETFWSLKVHRRPEEARIIEKQPERRQAMRPRPICSWRSMRESFARAGCRSVQSLDATESHEPVEPLQVLLYDFSSPRPYPAANTCRCRTTPPASLDRDTSRIWQLVRIANPLLVPAQPWFREGTGNAGRESGDDLSSDACTLLIPVCSSAKVHAPMDDDVQADRIARCSSLTSPSIDCVGGPVHDWPD